MIIGVVPFLIAGERVYTAVDLKLYDDASERQTF